MTPLAIFLHLCNFAAPALALALLLPFGAYLLDGRRKRTPGLPWQIGANFLVGLTALSVSLWWLGRDGKMAGYTGLVLAVATSQWLLIRGWRRR